MPYSSDHDYERRGAPDDHADAALCNPDGTVQTSNEEFDILSFLSVLVKADDEATDQWPSLVLLSIHLGPWNLAFEFAPHGGEGFFVHIIPRKILLQKTVVSIDEHHHIPKFVALKTPKLSKDQEQRNSRLLRSIVKEFQILQSEPLRHHDYIVTTYGCCWQSLDVYDGLPIPCLVLEGAELGDLVTFNRTQELTLRERLRIGIHVASGLQAIHDVGIVHGDVKPENILIFRSSTEGYRAKIADFGSAIVLAQTVFPCPNPKGTSMYRAPECYDDTLLDREGLLKTDIFSLGIVLAMLIQGMYVQGKMDSILTGSRLESLKKEGQLGNWICALALQDLNDGASQDSMECRDLDDTWEPDFAWDENSPMADPQLWSSFLRLLGGTLAAGTGDRFRTEEVLSTLRKMLRLHLRRTLKPLEAATAGTIFSTPNPEWWAEMGSKLSLSRAQLRKATGVQVASPNRLNRVEIEAISLSYLQDQHAGGLKREAQFIRKFNTNQGRWTDRSPIWRLRAGRIFTKKQKAGKSRSRKPDPKVIEMITDIAREWNRRQHVSKYDLRLIEAGTVIFKATENSNLFWTLPHPVKQLLENTLIQKVEDMSVSEPLRADAAYEFVVMVINSQELTKPRLVQALDLLAQSATLGHPVSRSTFSKLHRLFDCDSPIPREMEVEWLVDASKQGSLTAQKSLHTMEPELFKQTMQAIRRHGGSCPKADDILLEQCQGALKSRDLVEVALGCLHSLSRSGDFQSLRKLTSLPRSAYNIANVLGETPLVVACRAGHMETAALLLQRGSDPRVASRFGATALHFLSAFDDDDIPRIAELLLSHGAELDRLSENAVIYKEVFDSPYNMPEGSPLLWAVAARNTCAVRTLLSKGADPFKHPMSLLKSSSGFDFSPILFAATLHLHHLLKMLLTSCAKTSAQRQELRGRLNAASKTSYRNGPSPLLAAIDCHPGFKFREYLIHGAEYEFQALKCVQLLIAFGANPLGTLVQGGDHPILVSCISGNLSTLRYLWSYKDGLLKPSPSDWLKFLPHILFARNRLIFDFMIEHRKDIDPDLEVDKMAVTLSLVLIDDSYFALRCLGIIFQPRKAVQPSDYVELFLRAIEAEKFDAANLIARHGHVSSRLRMDDATVLGHLIMLSQHYPNVQRKMEFLFSLGWDQDEMFSDVLYLAGTGLTALQTAVYTRARGGQMNVNVFRTVLEHFREARYINSQIKGDASDEYAGCTALHLAARWGNSEAAGMLMHHPEVALNLLNCRGESPADVCVSREVEFAKKSIYGPQEGYIRAERHNNLDMLYELVTSGGRISKYSSNIGHYDQHQADAMDVVMNGIEQLCLQEKAKETRTAETIELVFKDPVAALQKYFRDHAAETESSNE